MAEIKKINTELQPIDKLLDTSGDAGTSGQILSTTGSGTNWIDNDQGSITGTGVATRVAFWSDTTVLSSDADLYWDNTNKYLGIGTTTPQVKLDVDVGNSDGMGVSFAGGIATGEYQGIHFGYSENGNTNYRKSGLVFERQDSSARGKIHILNNSQAGSNSAALADSRVTIQYDGNVGIGTVTPDANLDIEGSEASIRIKDTVSGKTWDWQVHSGYMELGEVNVANNRFVIENGGDVGIGGVTDPDSRLEIKGAGASTGLTLKTTDSSGNTGFWTQDGGATGVHYYPFVVGMDHDDAKPSGALFYAKPSVGTDAGLFVKTDGNVGIGTTSPDAKLQIGSRGTASALTINAASGDGILFDFYNDGSPYLRHASIIANGDSSASQLEFWTSPSGAGVSKALTLDSSQNATFSGDILAEGGDITVKDTGTDNAYFRAYATGTGAAGLYIDAVNGDASGSDYFSLRQLDNKAIEFNARTSAGNTVFYSKGVLNLTQDGANSTFAGNINLPTANYLRFLAAASNSDATVLFGNTAGTGGTLKFKRNSDSASILTLNGDQSATFAGNVTATQVTVPTYFNATSTSAVLGATGAGTVYLRPNGIGSSTGQLKIESSGNVTFAGNIEMTGTGYFGAADNLYIGSATSGTDHTYIGDNNRNVTIYNGATFTVASGVSEFGASARFNSWLKGSSDTNMLYSSTSLGTILQTPANTGSGGVIHFRNSSGTDFQTFSQVDGSADFTGQVTIPVTPTANAHAASKKYVDDSVTGAATYQGVWDARTVAEGGSGNGGSPDLTASTYKTNGYYFIVSYAGTAYPNGVDSSSDPCPPNSWHVGDWIIWNDDLPNCTGGTGRWQKIDNTSVISGAGTAGTVVKWSDTETLADGPITFSTNDSTFAGTGTFGGTLTIPDYIVHTGDGDTKIGFNTDDSVEIRVGGNLQINADVSRSYLRYQGSSKLYTDSAGVIITGNVDVNAGEVQMDDNYSIQWGGNAILKHTGSQTYLGDNSSSTVLTLASGAATFAGNITIDNSSPDLYFVPDASYYSFRVSAQEAVANTFEITPSTAAGGSTYSTPAFSILATNNAATFAGDISIPVAKKLYFGGGNHTYIGEDINDRLRFFTGGVEFMRFTEDTTDTVNFFVKTIIEDDLEVDGDITIGPKSYPKLNLTDNTGVARNFSVGTNNETFTLRNETGSADVLTIAGNDNSATFAGSVTSNAIPAFLVGTIGAIGNTANDVNIYSTTAGHNGLRMHVNGILPTDNAGTIIDNDADLGDPGYRFKDGYFAGNVYGDRFILPTTAGAANQWIYTNNTATGTGSLTIQAGAGSAGYGGGLRLYSHAHASKPGWVTAGISLSSGGKFSVNTQGTGGGTEKFTVDASGNGIFAGSIFINGFTNPNTQYLSLRDSFVPSASGGIGLMAKDHSGSSNDGLALYGHDGISMFTAQTERMRINSDGTVGIGPNALDTPGGDMLHVDGTLRVGPYFSVSDRDFIKLMPHGSDTKIYSPNERFHIENPSGDIIITPSSSGGVGIGTTSPTSKLHVVGDVTIDGTLSEEGSGSNKTYKWRTPSSTSWSGGVKNVKFGRIYWCPGHWTNGAVINITLQGSYYQGVERKYTVSAQYQDTDPIIQQLSVADTDNKIALKVGATTSAGYNYSGQPVYYADLNFVCNSYMVGWCIVESQMAFLTANPTSTWGGVVMDATLTEPDTSATYPDNYNLTFGGTVKASTYLVNLTTAVGIGTTLGDINGAELGPGYLTVSRDDTADAKQISFYKNNVEHSYLETTSSGLNIGGANVGIGTTTPGQKLQVSGASGTAISVLTPWAGGAYGQLRFDTGTGNSSIRSNVPGNSTNGLDFYTYSGGETVKMSILGNGNVGIGTTAPTNDKLHVETDASTVYDGSSNQTGGLFVNNIYHEALNTFSQIRLGVSGASGASSVRLVGIEPSQAASDFAIVLRDGSVWGEKLRIKGATGNVGIGTTNPVAKLHIDVVTEDNQPAFKITKVSDSGENAMEVYHGTSSALRGIADFTNDLGSVMFLRGDGNVGIGTTSPNFKLGLSNSTALTAVYQQFTNGTTGTTSSDGTVMGIDSDGDFLINNQEAKEIKLYTSDSQRLTIQSGGNVGIGMTSPGSKLHVLGGVILDSYSVSDPDAASRAAYPAGQMFTHYTEANGVSIIGGAGGYSGASLTIGEETPRSSNFKFIRGISDTNGGANAAEEFWVNGIGGAYFAGNVGIGTTSPGSRRLSVVKDTGITSGFNDITEFLDTTLGGGGSVSLNVGRANSSKNLGKMAFNYVSSGSNSNALNFGFYDADNLMTIQAGGNVGIGTTSPSEMLQVQKDQAAESGVNFINNSTAAGAAMRLEINVGAPAGNDPMVSFNVGNGGFDWTIGVDNSDSDKFKISGGTDSHNPNLGTNDRLTIDSSGATFSGDVITDKVGNGTSGSNITFTTNGFSWLVGSNTLSMNSAGTLSCPNTLLVTSTVTATNFILSSDETLKDNITEIQSKHIDVNWKNFELKSEPGVKRSGVIAQELEKKHPEFVRTDDEGLKSVAYIDLLISKIAELEARLEKLEK